MVLLCNHVAPWGPEAHRRTLLAAIEAAILALMRLQSKASSISLRCPGCIGHRRRHTRIVGECAKAHSEVQGLADPGQDAMGDVHCTTQETIVKDSSGQAQAEVSSPAVRLAAKVTSMQGDGFTKGIRMLRFLAILDSVHSLLTSGRHATARELFYKHVPLFTRQKQSDEILKSLCRILEVPRHYLHLIGTAKGLIRGHLRLLEPSVTDGTSSWVDCLDVLEPRGHIISPICAHLARAESNARTVLVVEKETVFYRLLDEGLLERHRPCIMVTSRGFPDVPTRYLLRRIQEDCASPQILLLVDFDAFGLSIAATYAFGPEDPWMQDDLELPAAVPLLALDADVSPAHFGLGADDTLPLTSRDCKVLQNLQRRFVTLRARWGAGLLEPWEKAATAMLEGGVKHELDAMDELSGFVDMCFQSRQRLLQAQILERS